jgi:hypothetical protein
MENMYILLKKITSVHINMRSYQPAINRAENSSRTVPDMETGCCLGPVRNGVRIGGGGRADPAHLKGEKISS